MKFHKIFLNKAFLLFILLSLLFTQNNRALSQGATSVEVDKVILESLNQTIPVIGRVISLKEANVPAAVIGKIENVFVEVGDIVNQGDIIGTVGSSGRSTGPHLDVRLNWFGIRLDPASILNIN